MVNKLGNIDGIPLYEDPSMEDGKVIKGHKSQELGCTEPISTFMIANPKTARFIYTIFIKKRLGREGFKAYNENRWIRFAAVGLTFCYCGASMIFFANTFPQIREIFSSLR